MTLATPETLSSSKEFGQPVEAGIFPRFHQRHPVHSNFIYRQRMTPSTNNQGSF